MQHAKTRLFSLKWDSELCINQLIRVDLKLLFDILFMFLGHINPKLWDPVNAIVVNLHKITEPRKK